MLVKFNWDSGEGSLIIEECEDTTFEGRKVAVSTFGVFDLSAYYELEDSGVFYDTKTGNPIGVIDEIA